MKPHARHSPESQGSVNCSCVAPEHTRLLEGLHIPLADSTRGQMCVMPVSQVAGQYNLMSELSHGCWNAGEAGNTGLD